MIRVRWNVAVPWAVSRLHAAHVVQCSPLLVPGVNAARDDTELATKQTKLLENKLEMSYIKLNEAMGRNKLIREDIDNLRRERCVFEQVRAPRCTRCDAPPSSRYGELQVYKKLERELHEKKREIASVIDVSNIAYEARDQARALLEALVDIARLTLASARRATKLRRFGRSRTRSRPRLRWSIARCAWEVVACAAPRFVLTSPPLAARKTYRRGP